MLRKTMIAIAAIGALSATALAPTTASAGGGKGWGGKGWGGGFHHHHHHRHWGGIGLGLGLVSAGIAYDTCMQKRWVETPYGARLRWVNVCAY